MLKCCIIIPVYKEKPDKNELLSFKQGINIFKNYNISIVSPPINLEKYIEILKINNSKYTIDTFENNFFNGLSGYNKLMTTKKFYKHYTKYKYILIYQLDAYVFKDELAYWCDKNYDYIGAPWFTEYGCHESGNTLWKVGNGGFSLRKVQFFIDLLSKKRPVYGMRAIAERNYLSNNKSSIKRFILYILYAFGYKNNIKYFLKYNYKPEDIFYLDLLSNSLIKFNCPSPLEAIKFAFECSPQYLYELNNRQLPFGCHAWDRYDFKFWEEFIQS